MPPLMFLTFLVALGTGFMSLAWMSRRSHHLYSPLTESLIAPLLLYNLWVLIWFVRQYTETTLLGGLPPPTWRVVALAVASPVMPLLRRYCLLKVAAYTWWA